MPVVGAIHLSYRRTHRPGSERSKMLVQRRTVRLRSQRRELLLPGRRSEGHGRGGMRRPLHRSAPSEQKDQCYDCSEDHRGSADGDACDGAWAQRCLGPVRR